MGILRADRVSGLGGANAINGSVFFGTSDDTAVGRGLIVSNTSDLDIGTGNFTIEYWFNTSQTSATGYAGVGVATWDYDGSSSTTSFNIYHYYKGIRIFNRISSGFTKILDNSNNWSTDTWHHFAWVREGTGSSENKAYIDGTQIGSAFTNAADYTTGQDWLIGANNFSGFPNYGFSGYISNVRVSNVARYTANFTAPTTRFEKDANTILLACQSPGNVLQEATGKIITAGSTTGNDYGLPVASHFAPDIGEDHGTTLGDNTKFDTLSYMVPPGGTSAESNRGRGMVMGGYNAGGQSMEYIQIQSMGSAIDFGDKTADTGLGAPSSSSTRALFAGGYSPANANPGLNTIEYVTIATTGQNALDFGDLTAATSMCAGVSNETRGIIAGGQASTPGNQVNTMTYVTIATTGNATDYGDLNNTSRGSVGCSSSTRGIYFRGAQPSNVNNIEYSTIATTGNATDFGDTTVTKGICGGSVSSGVRGLQFGGYKSAANINTIDYVTIATTGNATDFGDQTVKMHGMFGASNKTRGVYGGGYPDSSPWVTNTMQYVTIATTGDSADFGDLYLARNYCAGTSDCHGGLS